MSDPKTESTSHTLEQEAWKILRGAGGDPKVLKDTAESLKDDSRFGLARRILQRAREDAEGKIDSPQLSLELRQQHALCTYKDPDLPRHLALERALEILDHEGDLTRTVNQETLGLAGAIYKRKWQVDANKANLERSLAYYYERGHKAAAEIRSKVVAGVDIPNSEEVDMERALEGFTSTNAAFVLDQLASIEEEEARRTGLVSEVARERRRQAHAVRSELVRSMSELIKSGRLKKSWWALSALAEAQFGLDYYKQARQTLEDAKSQERTPWMFESTVRQLAQLASVRADAGESDRDVGDEKAWKIVAALLDGNHEAVRSLKFGQLGLALSGGGFRASLFHIGVLARLAEEDLLRHVHVLSCVSGGSIVGAHYYLEIRKLLQTHWDNDAQDRQPEEVLDRGDYVKLVERLAERFLKGIESNVRTQVAGSFIGNLKMAFLPHYSRTDRLGDLLESNLYSLVDDGGGRKRYLDELLIVPREHQSESSYRFAPKAQNWKRRNKVPMLVLNATSLNTGHNWQFTSTWMGESPFSIDEDIDGNWRLRRMWYSRAPDQYKPTQGRRRIRLGKAVGASACVPGLFEPVALPELYPKDPISGEHKKMTVRLVDGGVHDNQGVGSLLEQDCDVLIVSDASGQMTSQADPGSDVIGTLMRTNSVLMERVRQAQFQDLTARSRAGLLKGLMVVHLKKGLEVDPVDWKECEEPPDVPLRARSELLEYGIRRNVQELLAGIRTDLDSFTEVEAYALMTSGYRMAATYANNLGKFPRVRVEASEEHRWPFLAIESPLYKRGESSKVQKRVERMLEVASRKAFKIWALSTPLKIFSYIILGLLIVAFLWVWRSYPSVGLLEVMPPDGFEVTVGSIGWAAVLAILAITVTRTLGGVLGSAVMSILTWRSTLKRIVRGVALSTAGFIAARLHLGFFDRAFMAKGRLKRALRN